MWHAQEKHYVEDIPEGFDYISNSQEVKPLNAQFCESFDSYFVRSVDNDYAEVYGVYGIIPCMDKRIYKVPV